MTMESGRRAASKERAQALERGLAVLAFLNRHGTATNGQVAAGTGLTRSTAHRLLNVLVDLDLLHHDRRNQQYSLTSRVRELGAACRDEPWIMLAAAPAMTEWTRRYRWPLLLLTPMADGAIVRVSTDHEAPMSADHFVAGQYIPVASRIVWLLRAAFAPGPGEGPGALRVASAADRAEIASARKRGHAASPTACFRGARIGVPLETSGREPAFLVMRCLPAMAEEVEERSLWAVRLQQLAAQITLEAARHGRG